MTAYKESSLWRTAFPDNAVDYPDQRQRIVQAYERFRERVSHLLSHIQRELPNLTLHDITHVDALWEVASQIAGPNYPLNPAEALVLGGAFLLHDAAHCRAAYPGGLDEIRKLNEWRDAAARRNLDPETLAPRSEDFQSVLFDTLRVLHPKQAKTLAFAKWKDKDGDEFLFPDSELRSAYGDLIGEIAESHWFHPHQLENFGNSPKTAPVCLSPANWTVDPLKIAILLRTADACHLDAKRAPRFLMLLNQPSGISAVHWQFQSKINQLKCDLEREELLITGSPFGADEQTAWWQTYDAACLADRELSAADSLLRDFHMQRRLAAREVAGVRSPERFAKQVPSKGWYPVDTSLRISNIQSVVERFGGEKLYGDKPWLALRELIQNARDAIHAARSLGYLNADEGEIEVAIEDVDGGHWLHVTDNGIGMSRYVLTEVLLDFGHSLWRSAALSGEWSGLASSGFEAVGQFGIGFFSVFMLGEVVRVCTRRCEPKEDESDRGWMLEFDFGTQNRPLLREPNPAEKLKKPGTKVSVFLKTGGKERLCLKEGVILGQSGTRSFSQTCAHLAPAIDLNLYVSENATKKLAVAANDWLTLPQFELLQRIYPFTYDDENLNRYKDWVQLTSIENTPAGIIGRCAILTGHLGNNAISVTKGILAGYIPGIMGIIQATPQSDLARQTALPCIAKIHLQVWAEKQKNHLHAQGMLGVARSSLLAHYGASHSQLVLGKLGGEEITQQDLIERLIKLNKLVVHEKEVEHDSEDKVRSSDFHKFDAKRHVLELGSGGFFNTHPKWIKEIPDTGLDTSSWSIEAAFKHALYSAWGNEEHWTEDHIYVPVGYVDDAQIDRYCDVYTREEFDD